MVLLEDVVLWICSHVLFWRTCSIPTIVFKIERTTINCLRVDATCFVIGQ